MTSIEPPENPYAAPEAAIVFAPAKELGAGAQRHLAWAVVFGANLIAPLFFGLSLTRGSGRIGVGVAIVLMLLLGHLACACSRTLGVLLVSGGTCVGLSQVWPGLQMIAGMISLGITARLLHLPHDDVGMIQLSTAPRGFLMTVLTGGQLMIAALLCGKLLLLAKSSWEKWRR